MALIWHPDVNAGVLVNFKALVCFSTSSLIPWYRDIHQPKRVAFSFQAIYVWPRFDLEESISDQTCVGRTWSYQCLLLAISAWLLAVKSMLNPMIHGWMPLFLQVNLPMPFRIQVLLLLLRFQVLTFSVGSPSPHDLGVKLPMCVCVRVKTTFLPALVRQILLFGKSLLYQYSTCFG